MRLESHLAGEAWARGPEGSGDAGLESDDSVRFYRVRGLHMYKYAWPVSFSRERGRLQNVTM